MAASKAQDSAKAAEAIKTSAAEDLAVPASNAEQPTQIVTAEEGMQQQIQDDHRLARSLSKDEYIKQKAYTQYLTRSINDEYDCDASEGGQWGHQIFVAATLTARARMLDDGWHVA